MSTDKMIRRAEASFQIRTDNLPDGIAGRVTGVAVTFNTVDTYDTTFAPGSFDQTMSRKVQAGKVPLLMDHERSTKAHVGIIRAIRSTDTEAVMDADIFDTASGREALEYVKAVLAAGARTGLSVGFRPRRSEWVTIGDKQIERFMEIELSEISITPTPAVPGTDILAARNEDMPDMEDEKADDLHDLLMTAARAAMKALPVELQGALWNEFNVAPAAPAPLTAADAAPSPSDAPEELEPQRFASMQDRLDAIRQSL